ncbi:MAG: hypothetical protein N4P95_01580 [Candidatus Lightella neohaematopini]|nr:hypothetical protein [Candidatus Lightella neohaematopini]
MFTNVDLPTLGCPKINTLILLILSLIFKYDVNLFLYLLIINFNIDSNCFIFLLIAKKKNYCFQESWRSTP